MLVERCAVLDIGSNTVRLLIAETDKPNHGACHHFNPIHYYHNIVRLGEGLQHTGQLSEAGMSRALLSFQEIVDLCQTFGIQASAIKAVATAAVREASNGKTFIAEVKGKTGLHIEVIAGKKEAALALVGAQRALSHDVAEEMCLFDIGGGSTEFSKVSQGKLVSSLSLKLGVVRLTEQYLKSNAFSLIEYEALKTAVHPFIDMVENEWGADSKRARFLVGTAGTVTTLAAIAQDMVKYDATKINGYVLQRADFYLLRDQLLKMSSEERLSISALEKGREDVIVAGLAIIDVMFERWGYGALISVDSGLLEGLVVDD